MESLHLHDYRHLKISETVYKPKTVVSAFGLIDIKLDGCSQTEMHILRDYKAPFCFYNSFIVDLSVCFACVHSC